MGNAALNLYDALTNAGEDKARAKLIAEAFGQLEERYPAVREIATQSNVRETELRLQKEIEGVKKEIEGVKKEVESVKKEVEEVKKEVEGVKREVEGIKKEVEGLKKEVEGIKKEIEGIKKETAEVKKETESLRREVENVRLEIKTLEIKMITALHRQTLWIVGSVGAIVGLIRFLDFFMHNNIAH